MRKDIILKNDKYRKSRNGYARLLNIYCRKCAKQLLTYQKDGPGNLRRLYFDRIFAPSALQGLQYKDLKSVPALRCKRCGEILGQPYVYLKEKRKAFRLFQASVVKKIKKI